MAGESVAASTHVTRSWPHPGRWHRHSLGVDDCGCCWECALITMTSHAYITKHMPPATTRSDFAKARLPVEGGRVLEGCPRWKGRWEWQPQYPRMQVQALQGSLGQLSSTMLDTAAVAECGGPIPTERMGVHAFVCIRSDSSDIAVPGQPAWLAPSKLEECQV